MPAYDPQQPLRKDPARRVPLLQGLRGRPRAGLPRHHAARARAHAGDPEGPCPQHPRHHRPTILPHVARAAHKIAAAAMKAFQADGITVQQFTEPAGGQVVFHLHMHVMPRHNGIALLPPASRKEDVKVLEDNATKLIAALRLDPLPLQGGGREGVYRAHRGKT